MNTNAFRRLQSACAWALFSILLGNGALGVSARQTEQKPASPAATREQPAPMPLELGKPVEREIKGGEKHAYVLDLEAEQFVHAEFQQKGVDVVVVVFKPDDTQLIEADAPSGAFGSEQIFLVAEMSGTYRFEVRVGVQGIKSGKYEAKLVTLHPADSKDRDSAKALRTYAEGCELLNRQTKDGYESAIAKFESALATWRAVGDQINEARTLDRLGTCLYTLGKVQQALESFRKALLPYRETEDRVGEAGILSNLGLMHVKLGEYPKGLEYYERALSLHRANGDQQQEAVTLNNIGTAYKDVGENYKALGILTQALQIHQKQGNLLQEAVTLINLAAAHTNLSEYFDALGLLLKALAKVRAVGNRDGEATTLNGIGFVYATLGERSKAVDFYLQALDLFRTLGSRRGEAALLNDLGIVHLNMGNSQTALDYFSRALALRRAIGDRRGEALTLNSMGSVYQNSREFTKSLDYFMQALPLHRANGNLASESTTLNNIGFSQEKLDDTRKAFEAYGQSLALSRQIGDRHGQAKTLVNLARLERNRNNLQAARSGIEEAVKLTEFIRADVTDQTLRTSYFAQTRTFFELYLDILMRLHEQEPNAGHDAEALTVSEQSRARTLLELFMEARADIRQGVEPKLLEREKNLRYRIAAKSDILVRIKPVKGREKQAEDMEREISTLTTELDQVRADIRQKSPRYAALTQPQPLSLKEIQTQLDADTMLLEYALGDECSYLWAVTHDGLNAFKLPKGKEIEDAARKFHAALVREGDSLRRRAQSSPQSTIGAGDDSTRAAEELSGMILGPAAEKLDKKRLVVVADGALQYIPFATLPLPSKAESGSSAKNSQLLIERCEVVNLPSATVLALQRRDLADRRPAAKQVAVIADPVFDKDDVRVIVAKAANARPETIAKRRETPADIREKPAEASALALPRAPFDSIKKATRGTPLGEGVIPRLSYAGREARNILALVTKDQSRQALDFDASLDAATSPDLSGYKIVHFATHGVLNAVHPELSGILLSLVDRQGVSRNGFLGMLDIFNLNLPAETVVLSACQTGLGKEIKGEGLAGLSRAFMYAGARRVVVSLWSVDDQATSELMTRFYRKVLRDKQRPAAALRAAQLELMREKQWKSPFYWAPFVVQGEWN